MLLRHIARGLLGKKALRLEESKILFASISRNFQTTNKLCEEVKKAEKEEAPPEEKTVLVDKEKNITLIGINRPTKSNAIDSKTATKLCEAFREFEEDVTSPIAVLYGCGGSFCAGYDISEIDADNDGNVSIDLLMNAEGSVGPTRRRINKPVVCGINGYCVANGLELALMCDLRVMEESAILGFFNRRFGVPVLDGGTCRLPAMIGFSRALDLILTGRQVGAAEAHAIGIANRIVPTGNALVCSLELAHQLAKFPQSALNHDRNSLYSAVFDAANFQQAIQNEIMYTSKDIIEQMQQGIRWYNNTFKSASHESWLKRDMSMADWDDEEVAQAAAKIEVAKQEEEAKRVEAEQKKKAEAKQQKKDEENGEKKQKTDEDKDEKKKEKQKNDKENDEPKKK